MILDILQGILQSTLSVLSVSWWILLPLALAFIFWDFWKLYVYVSYLRSLKWVLLEIKIPAVTEKTPKAMEQVFAAIYSMYSYGYNFMQKYWEGHLVEDFASFELVGSGGGIHFYIRIPEQYRNIIESAIYSQYPDAEIHQAEDYTNLMPRTLPNKIYDLMGFDYHLAKEDPYPIRTYEYFESPQEEKRLDPVSAITEVMSKLKDDEALWIQIFVRPTGDAWKKKGEELRDKLAGRSKPTASLSFPQNIWHFLKNLLIAAIEHPVWPEEKKQEKADRLLMLTSGERDIIEEIERKISKIGFEVSIRFIYIDKRESFTRLNVAAAMSTFNQFNTLNLNGLRPNIDTMTVIRGNIKWFKKSRLWARKRRMHDNYRRMRWPRKRSILNTEELATLYHVPTFVVEAPLLRRLGAKKGEPPAGLPVE